MKRCTSIVLAVLMSVAVLSPTTAEEPIAVGYPSDVEAVEIAEIVDFADPVTEAVYEEIFVPVLKIEQDQDSVFEGALVTLKAKAEGSAPGWSSVWQQMDLTKPEGTRVWTPVQSGEQLVLTAVVAMNELDYRAVLVNEAGVPVTEQVCHITVLENIPAGPIVTEVQDAVLVEADSGNLPDGAAVEVVESVPDVQVEPIVDPIQTVLDPMQVVGSVLTDAQVEPVYVEPVAVNAVEAAVEEVQNAALVQAAKEVVAAPAPKPTNSTPMIEYPTEIMIQDVEVVEPDMIFSTFPSTAAVVFDRTETDPNVEPVPGVLVPDEELIEKITLMFSIGMNHDVSAAQEIVEDSLDEDVQMPTEGAAVEEIALLEEIEEESLGIQAAVQTDTLQMTAYRGGQNSFSITMADLDELEELEDTTLEIPMAVSETVKHVSITSSRGTTIQDGEVIELTANLTGFEAARDLIYIWEINRGEGWEEAARGEEKTFTYTANVENLKWEYRIRVLYR